MKRYFDRPAVYGEADDLERFLLFSRAVMEVPQEVRLAAQMFFIAMTGTRGWYLLFSRSPTEMISSTHYAPQYTRFII